MDIDSKEELGVLVEYDFSDNQPKIKAKRFNPRLKIYREFTLATVSALTEIKKSLLSSLDECATSQVSALDALSCTGISGIQWKKHLTKAIHVTLADNDDVTVITNNAKANSLTSDQKLSPLHMSSGFNNVQNEKEILVCQTDVRTIMYTDAFNFINLNPSKYISTYFEPALSSLTNNGILCIICPDVSLFARSPHVVQRNYGANVVKTEYLKELSARIIIGNLTRCAARFNKGITVNYIVSHDDNLLICITVNRGHAVADSSTSQIAELLHCRLCEQRNFLPQQLAPIEDPYSFLHCSCKEKNPGKTAVVLGPMWKGPIFNKRFLHILYKHGEKLKLSSKFFEILHFMLLESSCSRKDNLIDSACLSDLSSKKIDSSNGESHRTLESLPHQMEAHSLTEMIVTKDSLTSGLDCSDNVSETEFAVSVQSPSKRKVGDDGSLTCTKKIKADTGLTTENVPFYYNISKFRRTNIPKLDKLVTILHCQGHKASRTHFDHSSIRTSANVAEFLSTLT
ncbi:TRMT1-like protein [Bulinus truncatus]|nr:TRMT1-like protein [Bulinus truncatus]